MTDDDTKLQFSTQNYIYSIFLLIVNEVFLSTTQHTGWTKMGIEGFKTALLFLSSLACATGQREGGGKEEMCSMRRNSKQYSASPARMHLLHRFCWSYSPARTTESWAACRVSPSTASIEQDAKAVHRERVVTCAGRWPQCCAKLCKVQAMMQGSARWDLAVWIS